MKECNITPPEVDVYETEEKTDVILKKSRDFPIGAFVGKIQYLIRDVAKDKAVSRALVGCTLLSLVSACIGRARGVRYNNEWEEFGNLYFLILADSSAGKSHVFNYIFQELQRIDNDLIKAWEKENKFYQNALHKWRKSKGDEDRPIKPPKKFNILNDATMEAALERLSQNPKGLVWTDDEFYTFFKKLGRYTNDSGDAKSKLATMWGGSKISISRKNNDGMSNEINIEHAVMSIFGAMQPGLLTKTFKEDDLVQGIVQRFLFCHAECLSSGILPKEINNDITRVIKHITNILTQNLILENNTTEYLELSPEAKELFDRFYINIDKRYSHTVMTSFSSKMKNMTLRLALVIHYLNLAVNTSMEDAANIRVTKQIGKEVMDTAIALADYFILQAEKVNTVLTTQTNITINNLHRKLAKIIMEKEDIITQSSGMINSVDFYSWTAEFMIDNGISKKSVSGLLENLLVEKKKKGMNRYKFFSKDAIDFCRKVNSLAQEITESVSVCLPKQLNLDVNLENK